MDKVKLQFVATCFRFKGGAFMVSLLRLVGIATLLYFSPFYINQALASAEVSCECPKLECDTCHDEQGVTFYSERCGPGGARVRSCARPTCALKDPAPSTCAKADASPESPTRADLPEAVKPKAPLRLPASAKIEERGKLVGALRVVRGSVSLESPDGSVSRAKVGTPVYEKDTLETKGEAQAQVDFKDGNQIVLQSDSKLKVDEYEADSKKDKRAVLDLIHGKVRNKVQQKYDGAKSSYQVKTRAAVAGVRGTDFFVSYFIHPSTNKVESKVETLSGHVMLASLDDRHKIDLFEGQGASFVVSIPESKSVFTSEELGEFAKEGFMTPVFMMSEKELDSLEKGSLLARAGRSKDRSTASQAGTDKAGSKICKEPAGAFNQCLWTCLNNPKGQKNCRTDLPQVSCHRKRCNADGKWSDEFRLPASFAESCPGQGQKVAPCDY